MNRKFLFALLFVFLFVSSAMATPYLWTAHYSVAYLKNGKTDYSDAKFSHIWLDVTDSETTATQTHVDLTGTFTLSGGNYSYVDKSLLQKVSGTSQNFNLVSDMSVGSNLVYALNNSDENYVRFIPDPEKNLAGVTATWKFPSMTSLNGQGTIPTLKTTEEQLNDCVPYVEFVTEGSKVTGLKWRMVKSSDVSQAVSEDVKIGFIISRVWKKGYDNIYSGKQVIFLAGNNIEGTDSFNTSVDSSDIWGIRVGVNIYDDGNTISNRSYRWDFITSSEPNLSLWSNHISTASLVDGKSDYSNAKFRSLTFNPRDTERYAESKYFVDSGRLNISGGGYTVINDASNDVVETVNNGTDKAFKLLMVSNVNLNEDNVEYETVSDNGKHIVFGGGAEKGLNGKTITWTFPENLKMSGSAVIPNFKSTSEQLAQGVPFIELVSSDGKITSIKYKIVKASDTSTSITPSYKTDFRFYVDRTSGGYYYSKWQENKSSGEWALSTPQSLDVLRRVRVRIRTYENENNPCVYQWNFIPSSSTSQTQKTTNNNNISSSGSGCELGIGILSLAVLAGFFISKR